VELIQTDAAGLLALAAHCRAQAARLGAVTMPGSAASNAFQPSAVAVQAAHTEVAAAGTRMATRMSQTAAAATAAAGNYAAADHGAAADIASVGATVM